MKTNSLCLLLGAVLCIHLFSCEKEMFPIEVLPEKETHSETNELSVDEAKNILLSFIGDEIKTKTSSSISITDHKKHVYELSSVYTRSGESVDETIPVYEFIVKEDDQKGFALVVGDKRIASVLTYIPEGSFAHRGIDDYFEKFMDKLPDFLRLNLNHLQLLSGEDSNINYFLSQDSNTATKASSTVSSEESGLLTEGFNELYSCYLFTKWNQDYPYNSQVPLECEEYYNGVYPSYAPVGCLPVAVAQIMGYHRLGNYYWDGLLEKPTVEHNDFGDRIYEVGFLMYDLGRQTRVQYNCDGSPALANEYITIMNRYGYEYFLYDLSNNTIFNYLTKKHYTSTYTYSDYIIGNVKNNYPVLGIASNHAYVIDGYGAKNYPVNVIINDSIIPLMMNSGYYHINAGWGGYRNGWYLSLNSFIYYNSDDAVNFISVNNLSKEEYFYLLMDEAELTYIGKSKPGGGLGCPTPEPCENSGLLK